MKRTDTAGDGTKPVGPFIGRSIHGPASPIGRTHIV